MTQLSTNSGLNTTVKSGFVSEYDHCMDYLAFGTRINALRIEKGIKTQKRLAEELNVSTSIVSEWIRGEKLPSLDTAITLADFFGCCVEWLITGKGPKRIQDEKNIYDLLDETGLTDEQKNNFTSLINSFIQQNAHSSKQNNSH